MAALGHSWGKGVVTTPPTSSAAGVMTYTCARCGATRTEPFRQDWQSVTIDDQISINFILDTELHEDMKSVTINYVNQDNVVENTVYVNADDLVPYGDYYKVPAEIAPAQIGDTITVTITEADGVTTTSYSTSIAEYCGQLIDNYDDAKVVALAKASLEYGRTANDYFAETGFYHASTITSPYTDEQKAQALDDAKAIPSTLSAADDIRSKITSISFMALTKPEFRFYTTGLTEAEAIALNSKITVTDVNGEKVQGVTARFVKSAQNNDVILLEVKGIEAKNKDKVFTVDMGDFGAVRFSGNDFARLMANYNDETIAAFGAALYLYGAAAKALFA